MEIQILELISFTFFLTSFTLTVMNKAHEIHQVVINNNDRL